MEASGGGLVTALEPVLRQKGGLWIGWPGVYEDGGLEQALAAKGVEAGYALKGVNLTEEEVGDYYYGFSNEILWPLFHDLQNLCNFDPAYWNVYKEVNAKFAQVIARNVSRLDYIWVQDYHLLLVAKELRNLKVRNKTGFFLHTPFPPLDIFLKLPWRRQVLQAMMEYDLLGFQTARDRNNFLQCVESLIKGVQHDARRQVSTIARPERELKVGSFPISIDFGQFARDASQELVAQRAWDLCQAVPDRQIILGVDRLDYSKGLPQKLQAFRYALEQYTDLQEKVTLVQVVVPSREDIPEYQELREEVEGLVSEINGRFSRWAWVPVHYMYRNLPRMELLAYYRAAAIALVTPLKDGMNLVAKEYCAANVDRNGVLILSEFAGAAVQLRGGSLLVNPYDVESTAQAIYQAFIMNTNERRSRMKRLRSSIRARDIYWWVDFFLREARVT